MYCLQCFRYEKALINHKENCITINGAQAIKMPKATITRCDLSPRFFCIDAKLLCEFESDKI